MKTKLSIMALAAVMLFTGCEAYVVDRRPARTYAYHGDRYYRGDYYDRGYSYRRYSSYRRPVSYGYNSRPYYGHRRGYSSRPSTTVVVDTPVVRGSVRRWR